MYQDDNVAFPALPTYVQDPSYKRAVALLDADGGAGWVLFNDLANLSKFQDRLGTDPYAWSSIFLSSPFLR